MLLGQECDCGCDTFLMLNPVCLIMRAACALAGCHGERAGEEMPAHRERPDICNVLMGK